MVKTLSAVVEQSPISILITDAAGKVEYVNDKFSQSTQYILEEVKSKIPRIFNPGHMPQVEYDRMWAELNMGHVWVGEYQNRRKDDTFMWEIATISPLFDKQNQITNYVLIKQDITEQKQMLEDLVKAREKAEESDRLKTAFLHNVSHEIRTPMNGILGFADLLKEPGLSSADRQEYIQNIEKSGARMLNIINQIVDFSRIEAGIEDVTLRETDINLIFEQVYNTFKPEVEAKGLQLSFLSGLSSAEALQITDAAKLHAILAKLVRNAIKYTKQGSVEMGCKIADIHQKLFLQFYVKDTGIGIPKERQEAIFDRFVQADIEDKMAWQGAGLGLSISKAYVEMLGGKIWVESIEGNGSVFSFTLPYVPVLPAYNSEKVAATRVIKLESFKKLKILIVEDDEDSEQYVSIVVKPFSKEILIARTGTAAVKICHNNQDIDLILMDIQLPEMSGHDATRQIRQFNKEVVIIAQTAYALAGDREKALAAGCNDYITKPIKISELKGLIKKYFS